MFNKLIQPYFMRKYFLFFLTSFVFSANIVISQCPNFTISLGQNQSYCMSQSVTLSANIIDTSGLSPTISWSHNGTTLSDTTASISLALSFATTGTYIVTVTIDTCLEKDTVLLGLLDPGQINGGQVICFNQIPSPFTSVSLANIITGDTLNYVWESSLDSLNWTSISSANLPSFSADTLSQSTYFRRKIQIIKNGVVFCDSFSNTLFVEVVSGVSISAGFDTIVCPNNSFTFSGSITGIGFYQPIYQWSGPGGFSDTTLAPTIPSVTQANSGTYVLSATIGGCVLYDTVVLGVHNIDINSGQFNSSRTQLVECIGPSSSSGPIGFFLILPTNQSFVQNVSLDWGDGLVQVVSPSNYSALQVHNYVAGSYVLTVTVTLSSGCESVLNYSVFVGSSPSPASLALFVNQANGCLPHSTSFTFNVPSANVNGTTYTVDWGDGSPTILYTHPNTPPVLNHVYNQASCGNQVTISGTTYSNVYQPFVITQNPCSVQPQPSAAGLISVGVPPDASFTMTKEIICPNDEIEFNNTSDFGLTIPTTNGANCDSTAPFYWSITPDNSSGASNWNVVSGTLGSNNSFPGNNSFWSFGSISPKVKFNVSGTYIVDLFVENECGLSQYSDTICVIVPPVCSIDITDTVGCSVLNTGVSSSSVLPTCDSFDLPVQYAWLVTNPPGCSGCSSSLASPSSDSTGLTLINNSNSIQYFTVELTVTAIDSNTNTLLSNCESVCSRTIKVYPRVQISPLTSCTGQLNWNLTNQVNVPSNVTWQATQNPNVSGETISLQTSNLITDSLVNNSSTSQTVIYTVIANSIDGGCSDTQVFTVNLLAPIIVQPLSDDTICVGGTISSPLLLSYTGGTNPPSYQWKRGGLVVGNNANFTPSTFNAPGTYSFIGTVTYGPSDCRISDSDTATITVVPDPVVTIQPVSDTYCLGASGVDTLVVSVSGGLGSYSYQWYSSAINSNSGGTAIPGATTPRFLPSVGSVGTTYYYCEITQSGLNCNVSSATAAIVVTPAPTFSTQPIATQTICLDGTLSPLTVVYQNGTPGGTYQWYSNTINSTSGGTMIPGATSSSYSPPSNSVGSFYYYCVVTLPSGGCSSITSNVGVIIVRPDPVINLHPIPTQTICEGGTIGSALFAGYTGGVGAPSYQWQRNGVDIPSAIDSFYLPPSFNSADTVDFSVIINLSGNGCNADTSQIGEVIIVPDPIITLQPDSAFYCENASPVDTLIISASGGLGAKSFQWYSSFTNTNVGGTLIPGAIDSTFVPPVGSASDRYYYCVVTQTGSNCGVASLPARIFVTPGPTFSVQPIDSQSVCIDGTFLPLSVNYFNGFGQPSYQWFVNSVNSSFGGTLLVGDTNSSYVPSSSVPGAKYYYCEITFNSGGCSKIVSEVGVAIVKPEPTINVQPLSYDTICVGGTISSALTLNYTGGTGIPSYQWQEFGIDLPGEVSSSFTPANFAVTGNYLYTVVLSLSGSGCDTDTSQDAIITVVPDPVVTIQPVSDTYCLGASRVDTLTVSASGGLGSYSYQWYSDTINSNLGGSQIAGATDSIYVPLVGTIGTTYYYCVISQSGLNCEVISIPAAIVVTPAPTFSTNPDSLQIICLDGALSSLTVAYQNGVAGGTYQWYSNTVNSNAGGTLISGATNSSYSPPSNSVGTFYYYCEVTLPSGGCSSITSNVGVIIVQPDPVINLHPIPSQTICEGGTIGSALFAGYTGGVGAPSYQWQRNGVDISSATDSFYLPPSFSSADTVDFSVIINLSGNGCNADTSQIGEVIIVPDPIVSLQPINASYCQNATPVAPLVVQAAGGLGMYSYQWFSNNSNSNVGGIQLMGETDSTFTPPVSVVGTTYYYCEITQTGLNCDVTSGVASIIVILAPTFTAQPIDSQTVCLDGSLNALTVAYQNGVGTPTYQWYSNSINSYTGSLPIPGAMNSSYSPPSDSTGIFYYYCVVTLPSGGCSFITSDIGKVIIQPDPIISIQPIPSQSICEGGTIGTPLFVNYSGGVGTASYQWQNSGMNLAGANASSFTPSGITSPGTYSFSVVLSLSGSGCDSDTSQDAIITVVPDPIVILQPVSDTYCIGAVPVDTLVILANGGIGTYGYQWYSNTTNSNIGGILIGGATDSTFIPSVNSIGTIYYYCEIIQSGVNCNTVSSPASIVTTSAPTFTTQPIDSQSVCLDGTLIALAVSYQNGVGIPSYQWFVNTSNSYSAGVPINGATNSNYIPPSNITGTFYYYCVVSLSKGGCSSIVSDIAKVIINPDPIITAQPLLSQSICVGGSLAAPFSVSFSGGVGNPSYKWQRNGVNLLGDTNSSFLPTTFFVPDTIDYRVILNLDGSGCNSDTSLNAKVIVVNDPIMVQEPDSAIYCENTSPVAPLLVRATGGLGSFNYQWYSNVVNSNSGGTIIPGETDSTFIPLVSALGTVYYYCEISQTGLNCNVTSAAAKITTTPSPSFSNQPIGFQKLCVGGIPNLLSVSYIGGNNSASYQWYQNNVNSNIGGLPIVGAISNSYLPATTVSGVTYYYCVVSFSIGGCSAITSNTAEVEVLDDPVITNHPLFSQMICEGTTIGQPLTFSYMGGSGATSIAWYQTGSPDILINGISDTSFQPIIFTTAGTYKYYAVLTDSGKGCNNVNTLLGEIIVNPTPYVNLLNDTVLCNDSKLNINITTTIPSNITWSATPNNNVTGELTSIQTSFLIDDSLTNNTSVSQFVNYTITPNSFPHGCPGPDSNVMVKVQPDVILSNIPNVEICSGSPVNAILTANIPSTFNWFVSLDNPNVTGESLLPSTSNLITDRLVNNTNINQIVVYSVFLVSIDGSCPGIAQTFVVTVKPSIDLLNEDTLTICSGTKVNLSLVANTNVTFNWYADQSVNVLNETTTVVSSSLINDSLVNLTNSVQQVTYRVVGTSTSNGCSSPVIPVTVFVNPIPTTDIINDTLVCNNTTLSPISFNGPVIGTIYNWYTFDTTIGVGASSGINSIPGFITTNNTMGVKNSTFTLTPIFINNSVSCSGPSQSFVISVLPSPDVYLLSDIIVCNGIQVPQKIVAGSISGTIFNWQNSNTAISLNSSGIGNVPSFNATNLTAVQQFSSVSVTPMIQQSGIQCFGAIESYLITVNPSPQIQNSDIEICNGENTNILLNANIPSSFAWYATSTPLVFNETSFPIQTSVLINDNLSITSPLPQTVDYHVIPTSLPYGCSGPDSIIKVTVNPLPDVSFNILNTIFCDLQPINFQNTSVGSLNFHWDFGDGDTSFLFNPSHSYASPGNYTIKLLANNPLTGCSDSSFKSIVISKTPNSNFSYSDSVGCDILDVLFTADTIDLTAKYLWDFGNGNISQQIGFSGHQYLIPDCYDVSLTVTSKEGCVSSSLDTSAICLYEQPIADFIADRVLFSSLEVPEVKFTNLSQFSTFYLWDFGDGQFNITENPVHTYSPGANIYSVKLISSNNVGCQDSITKTIKVYQDIAIYVPNTFTPNRDQINQVFLPILTEGFVKETYRLTIFNRWGELIFQTRDINEGWDGLHKGKLCQIDSYIWKIYVEVANSSEVKSYTGHVNLIR